MPPRERLTREQKGKAVSTGLDPSTVSITSSENLARQHRDALGDMEGLYLLQRLLVVEAERLVRGEHDRDSRENESRESEGNSADARTEGPDFYPTRYSPDGYFEKLPAVPAELLCSPDVEGQDWEKVGETESTPGSVQKLLRECGARGVTFHIPTYLERPWSPPVGYHCMYEAYFQPNTKLWFPIPRLITSYVFRRNVALSQFVNGSYRIAVALMVLAAEIGVSMSVRAFEELTSLKAQPHGIFSVKMRPNYNILTGHPNKTPGWNHRYFYVKSDKAAFDDPPQDNFRVLDYPEGFFDNARAVAALSHQCWQEISEERIRRALARISEEQACIKRSKRTKELPDLSVLLGNELDLVGSNPMSILDGMNLGGGNGFGESGPVPSLDPPVETFVEPVAEEVGTEDRPRKKKKNKSAEKSQEGSVSWGEPITQLQEDLNRAVVHDQDVSSGEQLLRRDRKTPAEGPITRFKEELQIIHGPNEERDRVEFSYVGDCLLIRDPVQCAELVWQIRSGSEFLPPVEDLMFREEYARAAQAKLTSDGRMNLVVEKYDRALRDALVQLGQSEEALKEKEGEFACKEEELQGELNAALADRDRAVTRRRSRKERWRRWEPKLEQKNSIMEGEKAALEREKVELEQEKSAAALKLSRETMRLKESRTFEVTQERIRVETAMIAKCNRRFENIREHQSRRDAYETARNLYGQASGTRKCLQKLIKQGVAIPQLMVDLFAVPERRLESEAASLEVGEIPEEDLYLSPLILPSRFLDERILAGLDPHGSNVDLVDSDTIANLQAPSEPTDPVTGSFAADGDVVGDVVASLQGTDAHAAEDAGHRASA
ncbi:hypothetical protein N665_0353s0011 [Sinapis alba]|nr:hypothetical protein N665_0353s0011 [Sinapis alba]